MREIIETNAYICSTCKYGKVTSGKVYGIICNYFMMTGKRRECPVGICDKYKKKK